MTSKLHAGPIKIRANRRVKNRSVLRRTRKKNRTAETEKENRRMTKSKSEKHSYIGAALKNVRLKRL